jgi:hypothetical protein
MSSDKFTTQSLPGQLHGNVKTQIVTVSGGPTLLPPVPLANRKDFLVYNPGSETLYVGGSDVTISIGIPIPSGGSFGFQAGRAAVYATVSGANMPVRVMEIS